MKKRNSLFPALVVLALGSTLAACDGSSNSGGGPVDEDPVPVSGGRLIYSLDGVTDTLKMYDQTVTSNRFTGTDVPATENATLVLSNDGLTLAMLENDGWLRVVSSGLEHMQGDHPHTHEVSIASAMDISGVSKVVATTDHFSLLMDDGTGILIEAVDGEETGDSWTDLVYPTLILEGGQFLKFTANGDDPSVTDITVVDENDSTGDEGLIFLRPNADGFFAESISCADGVQETAQTEEFTIILCGDGTLRWLISGYTAPDGHPAAGQTIHVTQRYPETATRRAGANGEVTASGSAFVENITRLTTTQSADNVIAAWAEDQLWLVNGHGDHPHRASLYEQLTGNPSIVAVAVTTEDDAMTVLMGTLPEAELARHMRAADAVVVMKTGRNLPKIARALAAAGRMADAWLVERGTMPNQRVTPLAQADLDACPYFATVLVHGNGRRPLADAAE